MKKLWLLIFIVGAPLSAVEYLDFSTRPDRTTSCNEVFGFCPVNCLPNRSFMLTRAAYRNQGAQKTLWQDYVFSTDCDQKFAIQAVPIFQKSHGTRSTAKYFLFNDQLNLLVKGDDAINSNPFSRDIRAEWLGLPNNFAGTFSVQPKQQQFALWVEAFMPLRALFDNEFFDYFWVGLAIPLQIIENNINISQTVPINPAPTFPRDIIEALSNPALFFGKFGGKSKITAAAEVDFKFGTNLLNRDYFQLGLYSMLVVPLHPGVNQNFIFEPFIGTNAHFGYGSGVTFKLPLLCDNDCQIFSFFAYMENIYYFRNTQRRCFDILDKPWSRYMLLNSIEGEFDIPAINILTRRARVRPYNMLDLSTGFDWQISQVQVQLAYNLWARGREQLELEGCFPAEYSFAGVGYINTASSIPASAYNSTISFRAPNDVDGDGQLIFRPLEQRDIDLNSAAANGALSHRAHLSVGYLSDKEGLNFFAGFAAFVEISQYITALSNYGIWGKVGITF